MVVVVPVEESRCDIAAFGDVGVVDDRLLERVGDVVEFSHSAKFTVIGAEKSDGVCGHRTSSNSFGSCGEESEAEHSKSGNNSEWVKIAEREFHI